MAKLISITGRALSGEWGTDDEKGVGIPVLRTTNFTNKGVADYSNVITRVITKKDIEDKYLREGDIIIEKSGGSDKQPVGRVIYFDGPEHTFLFNNFTGLLRVKAPQKWIPKYVFYALYANYRRGGTIQFENKTTGLHNLQTDSYVKNFEIQDNEIEIQKVICEKLDKVRLVIEEREQQISLLDMLIKSRFVEMFRGDIAIETKYILKDVADISVGIASCATHAYADKGVVMLRNQNIKENYLDESDLVYLKPEFAELYTSKKLKKNDILVIRTGYPGVACLVPDKYEGSQTFTTLIVRLKHISNYLPMYICHYINSQYGKSYVDEMKVGVAQQNFGAKSLEKMPIAIPSIDKQLQFATFVQQVDKLKFANINYSLKYI